MSFLWNGSNQFWLPVTAIWRGAHQTFIKALSNNDGLLGATWHGFRAPLMIRNPETNWQPNRRTIHMKNLPIEGVIISLSFFFFSSRTDRAGTWVQWLSLAPPPRMEGLLLRRAFKKRNLFKKKKKGKNGSCTYKSADWKHSSMWGWGEREVSVILKKKKNTADWMPDWAWLNLNGFCATLICLLFQISERTHCWGSCGVILPPRKKRRRGSLSSDETSAAGLSAGELWARSQQIKAGHGEQHALGTQLRRSISCPQKTYWISLMLSGPLS